MKLPIMLRKTHDKEIERIENILNTRIGWHHKDIKKLNVAENELENTKTILDKKKKELELSKNCLEKKDMKICELTTKLVAANYTINEKDKKIEELVFCLNETKKDNIRMAQELAKTPKYKALG